MGWISLKQRAAHTPPDLGWTMLAAHQGHGYAGEAAREVARFARRDLGLADLTALVRRDLRRSCRLAERAGFVWDGEEVLVLDSAGRGSSSSSSQGSEVLVYRFPCS